MTSSGCRGTKWRRRRSPLSLRPLNTHYISFSIFLCTSSLTITSSCSSIPNSFLSLSQPLPRSPFSVSSLARFFLTFVTVNYRPSCAVSLSVPSSLFQFLPSECVNAFALVVRPPTEQENLLFSFQLAGEETVKSSWLRTLCRHVANTICRADAVRSNTLVHTEKGNVKAGCLAEKNFSFNWRIKVLLPLISWNKLVTLRFPHLHQAEGTGASPLAVLVFW